MGTILLECPKTGRPVSTGFARLEPLNVRLVLISDLELRILSPAGDTLEPQPR